MADLARRRESSIADKLAGSADPLSENRASGCRLQGRYPEWLVFEFY
jgi:hypothetical protein